jgi:hypothetical protein
MQYENDGLGISVMHIVLGVRDIQFTISHLFSYRLTVASFEWRDRTTEVNTKDYKSVPKRA